MTELFVNIYIIIGLLVVYYIGDNKGSDHQEDGYYDRKARKSLEVFDLIFIFYLWPIYLIYRIFKKKDKEL